MDKDGYPTADELKTIRDWGITPGTDYDVLGLTEYIRERWQYADAGYFELSGKRVLRLELHTAGWSGNESIIEVLAGNLFWLMCWERSVRGGHHYFRVNLKSFEKGET